MLRNRCGMLQSSVAQSMCLPMCFLGFHFRIQQRPVLASSSATLVAVLLFLRHIIVAPACCWTFVAALRSIAIASCYICVSLHSTCRSTRCWHVVFVLQCFRGIVCLSCLMHAGIQHSNGEHLCTAWLSLFPAHHSFRARLPSRLTATESCVSLVGRGC